MMHHPSPRRRAFTLLELLLVLGIIAVIAGIVILAINPPKQLGSAQSAKRASDMNQLEKALNQFIIDTGAPPDTLTKYSRDPIHPTPICSAGATDTAVCIDVSPLVASYIASVPKDPTEPCFGVTGYAVYFDKFGPRVVAKHDAALSECPVSIFWSDATHGIVRSGMATLATNLSGKQLTIAADASLNLNGFNVTGGSIVNNGTIVANGYETADVAGGAWKIIGSGGTLNVLGNQGTLSSLELASTVAGAVFNPTTALAVSGNLIVGSAAILDTTSANSTFNGAVTNYGAIILGDNAVHFNGGYDAQNGQTVFVGTTLPALTYHDLTINGNATVVSDTTVNGALTVNAGKALTITSGKTLSVNGGVNVNAWSSISGAGTLTMKSGTTLTVAQNGSLRGVDAAHRLALTGAATWYLQNSGNLAYLYLVNSSLSGTSSCASCAGNASNFSYTTCGNGVQDAGETCDDGNSLSGDGCSATCQAEAGWTCSGTPSWCVFTVPIGFQAYSMAGIGSKLFVLQWGGSTVSVIDATALGAAPASVNVGNGPSALAALGTNMYVANYSSNTVSVIDSTNLAAAPKTVNVGANPNALVGVGTKMYVANAGTTTVSVIDSTNLAAAPKTVNVGSGPYALAVIGTNVYVVNHGSKTVSVIDTTNLSAPVLSIPLSGWAPTNIAVLGTNIYVSASGYPGVNVIDSNNLSGTPAYIDVPASSLASLGSNMYAAGGAGTVSVIDNKNVGASPVTVTVGAPTNLAALGAKMYVTNEPNATVSVIDANNLAAPIVTIPVGSYPEGIATLGNFVYVANWTGRTVSVFAGH